TSFSETDRAARLVDIKVHTSAILAKAMDRKSAKALAAQRSFAHTSFMSGISTNLRHRYHTTTCLYVLFELIITRFESNHMDNNPTVIANNLRNLKFTEDSCIDTLAVELNDLMERYRASMTPPTFNAMDAAAISSIDGYTYIWIYHTLCVLSKAFIADTDLWDVIKNYVSTARATRVPIVLDDGWSALRNVLDNRVQRASALGHLGSAATTQARTQYVAITHAIATPAPPPQAISQPDGSFHVLNAFTIPAYAHPNCVHNPGKSCFNCGRCQSYVACVHYPQFGLSATPCVLASTAQALTNMAQSPP
ncbi:hypothetical protein DYB31_016040, partial [Aphanomyces astaci]